MISETVQRDTKLTKKEIQTQKKCYNVIAQAIKG